MAFLKAPATSEFRWLLVTTDVLQLSIKQVADTLNLLS